jgi:hypothetical protein
MNRCQIPDADEVDFAYVRERNINGGCESARRKSLYTLREGPPKHWDCTHRKTDGGFFVHWHCAHELNGSVNPVRAYAFGYLLPRD